MISAINILNYMGFFKWLPQAQENQSNNKTIPYLNSPKESLYDKVHELILQQRKVTINQNVVSSCASPLSIETTIPTNELFLVPVSQPAVIPTPIDTIEYYSKFNSTAEIFKLNGCINKDGDIQQYSSDKSDDIFLCNDLAYLAVSMGFGLFKPKETPEKFAKNLVMNVSSFEDVRHRAHEIGLGSIFRDAFVEITNCKNMFMNLLNLRMCLEQANFTTEANQIGNMFQSEDLLQCVEDGKQFSKIFSQKGLQFQLAMWFMQQKGISTGDDSTISYMEKYDSYTCSIRAFPNLIYSFCKLFEEQKDLKEKRLLLQTYHHRMALIIDKKPRGIRLRFFDPNITTLIVKKEVSAAKYVKNFSLDSYLLPGVMDHYFKQNENEIQIDALSILLTNITEDIT
jgi:hypothetical protein